MKKSLMILAVLTLCVIGSTTVWAEDSQIKPVDMQISYKTDELKVFILNCNFNNGEVTLMVERSALGRPSRKDAMERLIAEVTRLVGNKSTVLQKTAVFNTEYTLSFPVSGWPLWKPYVIPGRAGQETVCLTFAENFHIEGKDITAYGSPYEPSYHHYKLKTRNGEVVAQK